MSAAQPQPQPLRRIFSADFRLAVACRIENGESVSALALELGVRRNVLYRWRDAYRRGGPAALQRQAGRPQGSTSKISPAHLAAIAQRLEDIDARLRRLEDQLSAR